jgi:hypothetical protein
MIVVLKFQTPVRKANIVASIFLGMILANRAMIGKKPIALETVPKTMVEP